MLIEAIKVLKIKLKTETDVYVRSALDTAIKAIEKQIKVKEHLEYLNTRDKYNVMLIGNAVDILEECCVGWDYGIKYSSDLTSC